MCPAIPSTQINATIRHNGKNKTNPAWREKRHFEKLPENTASFDQTVFFDGASFFTKYARKKKANKK